jgi:hypothetical protein
MPKPSRVGDRGFVGQGCEVSLRLYTAHTHRNQPHSSRVRRVHLSGSKNFQSVLTWLFHPLQRSPMLKSYPTPVLHQFRPW